MRGREVKRRWKEGRERDKGGREEGRNLNLYKRLLIIQKSDFTQGCSKYRSHSKHHTVLKMAQFQSLSGSLRFEDLEASDYNCFIQTLLWLHSMSQYECSLFEKVL